MRKAVTWLTVTAALVTLLSGCKSTEPQYYYGDYTTAVYSYFKADDITLEAQITALQNVIEQASAKNKPVAPGVHAHLGMLYFEAGNPTQGQFHFEQEMQLFPESAQFLNFLLTSGGIARHES
ncbi:DUF4810 domain-containing protein [Alteromonas sp. CYL-A6]|uniref:DUF4810 domain-containing protein n=1 Tax=Alteromonas nitratireducens TaxID=3390813 RepID=UPI0034A98440